MIKYFFNFIITIIFRQANHNPAIAHLVLARLFVKIPQRGDSKGTFFSLRVQLPPVTTSLSTHRYTVHTHIYSHPPKLKKQWFGLKSVLLFVQFYIK